MIFIRYVVNCYPVATITAIRSAILGSVVVALRMERGHAHVERNVG